jgi:uncharacterized protein with NRDE domain
MCTLAVLRNVSRRYPLLVAANRDEFYARPAASPALLDDVPGVVAGRDLEAQGTWLGCRVRGGLLVAGLLNRRTPAADGHSSRGERSRGELCLDALRSSNVDAAFRAVTRCDLERYGTFNLLLADLARAVVVQNVDGARVTELDDGLSLLTNLDLNDPRCPRLASAVAPFRRCAESLVAESDAQRIVAELATLLASHDNSLDPADRSPFSRLCVHTDLYGTRSASVILVGAAGDVRYFDAPGPPCRTRFAEVDTKART